MLVFRQNIDFLLKFDKRTQVDLAARIGVSQSHLNHFLRVRKKAKNHLKPKPKRHRHGTRPAADNLSLSTFDDIADFFGVELWMLFRDDLHAIVATERDRYDFARAAKRGRK